MRVLGANLASGVHFGGIPVGLVLQVDFVPLEGSVGLSESDLGLADTS